MTDIAKPWIFTLDMMDKNEERFAEKILTTRFVPGAPNLMRRKGVDCRVQSSLGRYSKELCVSIDAEALKDVKFYRRMLGTRLDKYGNTLLHALAEGSEIYGMPQALATRAMYLRKANDGTTPLHLVGSSGALGVVNLAMFTEKDFEKTRDKDFYTLLHSIAMGGGLTQLNFVPTRKALRSTTRQGQTVYHLAATGRCLEQLPVQPIVEMTRADNRGETPLHRASLQPCMDQVSQRVLMAVTSARRFGKFRKNNAALMGSIAAELKRREGVVQERRRLLEELAHLAKRAQNAMPFPA